MRLRVAPVAVSSPGEAACRPKATEFQGVIHVAYEAHPGGYGTVPRQIVAATYQGGGFVSETISTSNNPAELWPAMRSHAGRLWVEWIDTESAGASPGELGWRRWNPGLLEWEPTRLDSFATGGDRDYQVRPGIRLEVVAP